MVVAAFELSHERSGQSLFCRATFRSLEEESAP